jgi:N-methylhydantoinase A
MTAWRVAVDVGGTFTDVVATDDRDRMVALKVPSTPDGFDRGVCHGVAEALSVAGVSAAEVAEVLHGTTVATNAVLEHSGPPVGLVTTAGFRDVLEIGRLRTPTIYDLSWRKPVPLAARQHRLEVRERIAADGSVLVEPDLDALGPEIDALVAGGVRSIAVSLLNAYRNPAHEQAVGRWLRERHPAVSVTLGTEVIGEIGEYERTSTAVLNAYLRPVVSDYLHRLTGGLTDLDVRAPTFVMQSSGGMMSAAEAGEYPVHLLESGPAAGVLAAAGVATQAGVPAAICLDMGGTTAKAALVENGEPSYAEEFTVGSDISSSSRLLRGGGYAVRLPVVDLAEIGAGGGSIASVDVAGGLAVGPASAGADPGPACYDRGGTRPTVTDANLLLGYVSIDGLRQGGVAARADLAEAAIREHVAEPLNLGVLEAAYAVHMVANTQMARVLRAVSTERGRALPAHTLIVSGGSGAVHAAALAGVVGIRRVLVPPMAGVLSAVGLLWSPFALTAVETASAVLVPDAGADLDRQLGRMAGRLRERMADAGMSPDQVTRLADLRYAGQASELTVALPDGSLDEAEIADLVTRFGKEHQATYGHRSDRPVTVVRLRVTAAVTRPAPQLALHQAGDSHESSREVWFGESGPEPVRCVSRGALTTPVAGPLLVDEPDTTIVVPPGWHASVDAHGNVVLERR